MQTVILGIDPFDPESWTRHDVEDVAKFCTEQFPTWPSSARIYHQHVSQTTDVTPRDEAGIERLSKLEGPFYLIVHPEGIELIIIAVIAVAAVAAAVFLLAPQPPALASRVNEASSPNNSLSERVNSQRISGRIGDIFGRVRSTPDLIAVPYKMFVDNIEVEIAYMCVGRGHFDIDLVRDGDTLVSEIDGASVEVYAPYTSPNSGAVQYQIGTDITDVLVAAKKVSSVNGQTLVAPGSQGYSFKTSGTNRARARANYTNRSIQFVAGGATIDFRDYWAAGQVIEIKDFAYNDGVRTAVLDATYTITSVTSTEVIFTNPENVNPEWNDVSLMAGAVTGNEAFLMTRENENVIGPFTIDMADLDQVYCNFVALGGLYRDDGSNQTGITVVIRVGLTPIDSFGNPAGAEETFDATLVGSSTKKDTIGYTLKCDPTFTGRCKVRAWRITQNYKEIDTAFTGNVVEEIKWRECYGIAEITDPHFGNLTTVYSRTYGTSGALAVKERKLNMYVTRKLPTTYLGLQEQVDKYVKLLLHFDGDDGAVTVRDYSAGDRPFTFYNNARIEADAFKFGDASLFCTSGTSDGITTPDHADFTLGSGAFTIEGWFKFTTFGAQRIMCGQMDAAGGANANTAWYIERTSGNVIQAKVVQGTTETTVTGTTVFSSDVGFIHVAFVRTGNTLKLFVNGVQEGGNITFSGAVNNSTALLGIGRGGSYVTAPLQGYVDEFRFSVGIARWTANFTPPVQCYSFSRGKLVATRDAADAITDITFDQYIGNRKFSELDVFQIYATIAEIKTYFGTDEAAWFNHTFDVNNLSFEEMMATIADAVFCTAYRRGNVIELSFEKATEDSTLLFNHRNKLPRTEGRTITFGNQNNHDGVWFNYTSDLDGSQTTYYIPADQSSINPRKIDSVGITSLLQAYFKAWRLWNKIRYQNTAIHFRATQEAELCVLQDRVLVADNTRDDTQDGEIIAQDGLVVTLSVDVDLTGDTWTMFIQHYDATVQGIAVTAGSAANKLVLAEAPTLPLALDDTNYARPTFVLVGANATREIACLVTEKSPQDNFTVEMVMSNYDERYYEHDLDHILEIV